MGKKFEATFLHSSVGLSILPDDLYCVARIGTKESNGIEGLYILDLVDLMKTDATEKFEAISINTRREKKKIRSFALLVPALAQVIHKCEISPAAIFKVILERIKIGARVPTTTTATVYEDTSTSPSSSSSKNALEHWAQLRPQQGQWPPPLYPTQKMRSW